MIYLIYSSQYPIVSKRTQKLVKSILGDEIDDLSYVKMNGREDLVQDIVSECQTMPFFGKKVVRVDEPYFLTAIKERITIEKDQDYKSLVKFIENEDSEDVILIFVALADDKSLNKKSEVYKALEKKAQIIFEEGLNADSLKATGIKYFEKKGCRISQEALDLLLERINGDVSLFIKEAEKLCLYSKDITTEDVHIMVPIPLEQSSLEICENLLHNRLPKAIKTYRDLLTLKEEPIRLLNLFATQFRTYLEIAYLYQIESYSQDHIAQELKIHPYRVKLACRELTSIKHYELTSIVDYLFYLDSKIKGMEIEPTIGLELFMINFNEIRKGIY